MMRLVDFGLWLTAWNKGCCEIGKAFRGHWAQAVQLAMLQSSVGDTLAGVEPTHVGDRPENQSCSIALPVHKPHLC